MVGAGADASTARDGCSEGLLPSGLARGKQFVDRGGEKPFLSCCAVVARSAADNLLLVAVHGVFWFVGVLLVFFLSYTSTVVAIVACSCLCKREVQWLGRATSGPKQPKACCMLYFML